MDMRLRPALSTEPASAGALRIAMHRWLMTIAEHVRSRHPDGLLDRLKPDGELPYSFLDTGTALLDADRIDAARSILERGASAFPECLALVQAAAALTQESGRLTNATAYWEAAAQSAPDDPRMVCGLSASLRANFQPARASAIIEAALMRYPEDLGVMTEAARVAALRGRHERALTLWRRLAAGGVATAEAEAGREEARAALSLIEANETIASAARDQSGSEVVITQNELMLEFESLGDNCEFGLAQRYSGVNPLGLFRFTESEAAHLDHAFATCFETYGTDEDLVLDQRHGDQEYLGTSRGCGGFKYHTEIFGPGVDEAELRKTELRKLAYLKQRMLEDVRSGEKIFVRKQGDYPMAMELSRTIRAMGPNTFLWVETADADHPVGHVEVVEPGLLRGYVSTFAWYGDAHALELQDWVAVCLNALSLVKRVKGQQVRYRLPASAIRQTGRGWDIATRCLARHVGDPSFEDRDVTRLSLLEDTQRWDAVAAAQRIEAPVSAGCQYVFSVWVNVPASFEGTFIDVYFTQSPEGYLRRADLDKRDVWQRIYASTKMPKDCEHAIVGLRVTGRAGDFLHVATWRLETGYVPTPWPLPPDLPM